MVPVNNHPRAFNPPRRHGRIFAQLSGSASSSQSIRYNARSGAGARNQRKSFRVADGVDGQIDIEVRPVKMIRRRALHVQELSNGSVPEPWEIRKRHEQFLCLEQQPEAMFRDVRNLNFQSACAKRQGVPLRVCAPDLQPRGLGVNSSRNCAPARFSAQAGILLRRQRTADARAPVVPRARRSRTEIYLREESSGSQNCSGRLPALNAAVNRAQAREARREPKSDALGW